MLLSRFSVNTTLYHLNSVAFDVTCCLELGSTYSLHNLSKNAFLIFVEDQIQQLHQTII